MCIVIYDPLESHLGIDKNWNRLDYPQIIACHSFSKLNISLVNRILSLLHRLQFYCKAIQETQTVESDIRPTKLPMLLQTLYPSSNTPYNMKLRSPSYYYTAVGDTYLSHVNNYKLSLNYCIFNCHYLPGSKQYPSFADSEHADDTFPSSYFQW